MMYSFDSNILSNAEISTRKEWLETNALGDYASSTVINCNSRKYHGLLVTGMEYPGGRHVLVSSLDESVIRGDTEEFFSCHKYPDLFYPEGFKNLESAVFTTHPSFTYKLGDVTLTKEILMIPLKRAVFIRYSANKSVKVRVKPLLAFRGFHGLTNKDVSFDTRFTAVDGGISMKPAGNLPPLFMQVRGSYSFQPDGSWYYNFEYPVEEERGFYHREDLYCPGTFELSVTPKSAAYFTASTEDFSDMFLSSTPARVWAAEMRRRKEPANLEDTLSINGKHFIITPPAEKGEGRISIIAGYPWFNVWGRDMFIALPGLTFSAGREKTGADILTATAKFLKNGMVPNFFGVGGEPDSYNSVDASLWYIWAVQQMLIHNPAWKGKIRKTCWPAIKAIIDTYAGGKSGYIARDGDWLLHMGNTKTQLTWMDASAYGRPVTSRHGSPVEINALWYNALNFAGELAKDYGEAQIIGENILKGMKEAFAKRFWLENGYLADVWRENDVDASLRPNQVFAVSMPYSICPEDKWLPVMEKVRDKLLTPYGLRTLSQDHPDYRPVYEGSPEVRDSAYHQGTVWPWLLGGYAEGLMKASKNKEKDASNMLETLSPLFSEHLSEAGIGSISEIFSGDYPHKPDGTVYQAWSVAECLRLLKIVGDNAPKAYKKWNSNITKRR